MGTFYLKQVAPAAPGRQARPHYGQAVILRSGADYANRRRKWWRRPWTVTLVYRYYARQAAGNFAGSCAIGGDSWAGTSKW